MRLDPRVVQVTHRTIGTRTSSGSKNKEWVHSLSLPARDGRLDQFPLTPVGHLDSAGGDTRKPGLGWSCRNFRVGGGGGTAVGLH